MEQYYSVATLANKLQLSVQTVRRYVRLGKLKAVKINGQLRISENSVREMLNNSKKGDNYAGH